MSLFVLAVGLTSVAALLPVAGFQVQRAGNDDRKAVVGQNIAREFKTRGFLRPDFWRYDNNNNDAKKTPVVDATTGQLLDTNNRAITGPQSLPVVAIDPCMVNRFGTLVSLFAGFPRTSGGGPPMTVQRLTMSQALGAAADQACISQDDLSFAADPSNPDSLPVGGFSGPAANPTKRSFDGRFSWLATLVPVYGDKVQPVIPATMSAPAQPAIPVNRNQMILSIVVFNERATAVNPVGATERAAAATFGGTKPVGGMSAGIGAGELQITDRNTSDPTVAATQLAVNVGEWIMLGAAILDPNAPGATPPKQVRPFFRWYRVVAAGPLMSPKGTAAPPGSPQPGDNRSTQYYSRDLTIAGPDWNLLTVADTDPATGLPQFWACIYDGAVGVYERTVRLEGTSMWSN